MYHIISDISNPVNLQQYIDNRDGFKRVGLKSFTYCCGWHNIHNEVLQKESESPVRIPSGYYSFQQLADIFHSHKISMSVNETNGRVTLSTPSELKDQQTTQVNAWFPGQRSVFSKANLSR